MRIVSRYILKQHAVPFLFALSATTGIMLLNQIAKRFGDLVGKGLPWSVIVEVFALSIPFIVAMTLPMAVLVAVLYAFSRLTTDNELTALKANGVSLVALMRPLLIAATAVAIVAFLFSDHVLPRSNHRLRTLLTDIARKKPTFALKEQVINEVQRARFFLRAGQINQSNFQLRDVTLYDMGDQDRSRVVYADSGEMSLTANQEDLHLTLFDGVMHEFNRYDPKMFQQMKFRRDIIRITGVSNAFEGSQSDSFRGDREVSTCEMEAIIAAAEREEKVSERRARSLQQNDLRALVGLAPLPVDTAVAQARPSLYCAGIRKFASFLLPSDLKAEQQGQQASRGQKGVKGQRGQQASQGPQASQGLQGLKGQQGQQIQKGQPVPLHVQRPGQRPDSLPPDLVKHFNEPARQALITGNVPVPRWGEVQSMRERARGAKIRAANYLVEAHKKRAIAVACIVFVLIGVPAALRFPRGGVGLVIGLSMVVFTIYYIGLIAGETLGNHMIIPPFLAMWSSNILFSAVGLYWLWRIRAQGTRKAA